MLSTVLEVVRTCWGFFNNRSRLRITLKQEPCGPDDPRGSYLVTSVSYRGQRPITLQGIGFLYPSGLRHPAKIFWPKNVSWPLTLTDSQLVKGFVSTDTLGKHGHYRGYAEDADEKVHMGKRYTP